MAVEAKLNLQNEKTLDILQPDQEFFPRFSFSNSSNLYTFAEAKNCPVLEKVPWGILIFPNWSAKFNNVTSHLICIGA